VSEKVVNGFIGCELMNELRDGWLRGRVDGVFWEDEKLVVITEEEYERLHAFYDRYKTFVASVEREVYGVTTTDGVTYRINYPNEVEPKMRVIQSPRCEGKLPLADIERVVGEVARKHGRTAEED
jgi:hypothetical protein